MLSSFNREHTLIHIFIKGPERESKDQQDGNKHADTNVANEIENTAIEITHLSGYLRDHDSTFFKEQFQVNFVNSQRYISLSLKHYIALILKLFFYSSYFKPVPIERRILKKNIFHTYLISFNRPNYVNDLIVPENTSACRSFYVSGSG